MIKAKNGIVRFMANTYETSVIFNASLTLPLAMAIKMPAKATAKKNLPVPPNAKISLILLVSLKIKIRIINEIPIKIWLKNEAKSAELSAIATFMAVGVIVKHKAVIKK